MSLPSAILSEPTFPIVAMAEEGRPLKLPLPSVRFRDRLAFPGVEMLLEAAAAALVATSRAMLLRQKGQTGADWREIAGLLGLL